MSLRDPIEKIRQLEGFDAALGVQERLTRAGGWRGLFDPHADEWNRSNVVEKMDVLLELTRRARCTLHDLVWAFREEYKKDRPDIALAAIEAVCALLEEAMVRLKMPELERFCRDVRLLGR